MAKRITGEMLNNFNIKSNMENIEQEVQQENNLLEGVRSVVLSEETTEMPQVVQLAQPKEAIGNMAEIERRYCETIERENR